MVLAIDQKYERRDGSLFQIQSNIQKRNKKRKKRIPTWRQSSAGSTSLTFFDSKASLRGCKTSSAWLPSNAWPADVSTSVIDIPFATVSLDTTLVSLLRLQDKINKKRKSNIKFSSVYISFCFLTGTNLIV
jgi:hypothetical protein